MKEHKQRYVVLAKNIRINGANKGCNGAWTRGNGFPTPRDGFKESGTPGRLSFWSPTQVWPIWPFVLSVKVCPCYVRCLLKKSIFCCADFGSAIALDLQQKLKPFLHFSKEQMALRSFLRIYNSFVQFRSSLR